MSCGILAALLCGGFNRGFAQTAHFVGVLNPLVTTPLSFPHAAAADSNGAIYIADLGNNRVIKEAPAQNGYVESIVASAGLKQPAGVGVDANGNVYIADAGNNRILKETLSNGGYVESVLPFSGLNLPLGIAVDASGDLFISDYGNAQVLEEVLQNGTYTRKFLLSGPSPDAIVVDAAGNVYFAAPGYSEIYKLTPSGSGYTFTYVGSGLLGPHAVAVDASGVLYIADTGNSRLLKETPSGSGYTQSVILANLPDQQVEGVAADGGGNIYFTEPNLNQLVKIAQSAGNFGTTNVGTAGATISLTFAFDTGGSIANPAVVTQGAPNLDFVDAGTGSCTTNGTSHVYSVGDTCTIDVTFTPKSAGGRFGAALLRNTAGNVIATGYVQGTGSGPELNFPPGSLSQLQLPNITNPHAMATDAAGNLYIAQAIVAYDPNNSLVKETRNGNGYTQSTIATGLGYPTGVAVDGAGNVYIADQDNFSVYKETPTSTGGYVQSIVDNTLGTVGGIAVDGAGNVYVGRGGIGVEKETLSGGSYIRSEIFYTFYADGIAVDAAGDLYFVDGSNTGIRKETPSTTGYTESIIGTGQNASRLVVDAFGNLYFDGAGTPPSTTFKETPSGTGYIQSALITQGPGVVNTVDSNGNVYLLDPAGSGVWKLNLDTPPSLSFAATPFDTISTDSPKAVMVENIGNAPLSFPLPVSGTNPSTSPSFTLDSNAPSACPLVDPYSSGMGTLAAGASCELSVSFVPAAVGAITGALVLTDNALNVTTPNYATQSILLSGSGTIATPAITWPTPAAITYGMALSSAQLDATASAPGNFTYSPAAGVVLSAGSHTVTATFTPTDTTDYTTATATVTVTVTQATPSNVLTSSTNPAYVGAAVTFTANLNSPAGTPTGAVSFYDGATLLGSAALTSGTAALTSSALAVGPHAVTAAYSGDSNFAAVTSSVLSEIVEDFTIAPSTGASTTVTASPGGQTVYNLTVSLPSGDTFLAPVTFNVTGLPTGATATFSPATIATGVGTTPVTLTVVLPASASATPQGMPFGGSGLPVALGLVLLPFAGLRRLRKRLHQTARGFVLSAAAVGVFAIGIAGCGGSSKGSQQQKQPQSYTLTVTAKSGSQSHDLGLTLTVD